MSHREKLIYRLGLVVVALTLSIPVLLVLPFASWYVRNIPDSKKKLPFAGWLRTHQERFYNWLADVLRDWFFFSFFILCLLWILVLLIYLGVQYTGVALADPLVILPVLYITLVFANLMGYHSAKSTHWDTLKWRAELAARALLGEYDDPKKEPDPDLVRHVMDAEIGINKAAWVVSRGECKMHHPAAEKLAKFGGPGVLIVEEGYAAVLTKSGRISRVVGRGWHFLASFERPHMIVPLATQAVRLKAEYLLTQDGGVLKCVQGLVFCKLDPGRRNLDSQGRYPFDDDLILEKVWSPKGGTASDAMDAIKPVSETAFRQVVARHTLHEFFDDFEQIRSLLREELIVEANKVTEPFLGFRVVAAVIDKIEIPPETEQKLWQRWAVVKDERIKEKEAEIEVERFEKVELEKLKQMMEIELDRLRKQIQVDATRTEELEKVQSTARIEAFLRLLGTMRVSGFDDATMRVLASLLTLGRSESAARQTLRRQTERRLSESDRDKPK